MANLVTMKIDGKEVQLPEGMNLIDAAESVGIHIPNLCHLKGMKGIGACRMCLVEIEGMKAPVTACTMKVKQDMKIKTDTERVKEIRKFVIDLILSMHPLDCMTCPKAGVCWLQQYAYDFDIRESTFTRKSFGYKIDNENPFIERDPNYCILCGRCVRVCKEQGTRILEFMGRGVTAKVTTAQDKPLHETDCTFCGNCIDACPVNAILEAGRRLHGREWEFTKTETTCTLCGSNCSLVVSVKEDNVIKIASPKPNGYICAAGRFGYDSLKSPKRISKPMIRIEGQLVETTWQDALKIIIEKLKAVKKNPSSAGFIASAGITNEDAYALQKFARAAIGTNNIDSTASLYDKATVDAYLNSFGKIPEAAHCITEADVIIAIGINPSQWERKLPAIDAKIRKRVAQGAKLIVVDPDTIRLADAANLHLQIKPGSDTLLLAGIMSAMISENLIDASSVKVKGFDELKKSITEYKKEVIEEITGVPYSSIVEAAKLYGAARTPFIVYSTGITRNTYGADIVSQILNLSMLKPSTVLPVGPEGNSLGMSIMGLSPQYLPGLQADKNKIEKTYKVELPTAKGKDFKQMAKGGMKFIYAAGDIPLSLVAPTEKPSEFLVVHASHTNELTDKADVVLPAPSFIEQGGTVINIYGKIKNIKNAVKPEADVKAVWEVLSELSVSMGYKMKYADISDVTGEIEKIISISGKKAPSFNPVAFRESEGIEEEAVGGMLRFSASVVTNSKVSQLFQVTV